MLTKLILSHEFATQNNLNLWMKKSTQNNQTLFQFITQHQLIDEEKFLAAASHLLNFPSINLQETDLSYYLQLFNTSLEKNNTLALVNKTTDNEINLIIANPLDSSLAEILQFRNNQKVNILFTHYTQLHYLYTRIQTNHLSKALSKNPINVDVSEVINTVISDAIHRHASDIHFEPQISKNRVRLRIDGILIDSITIPAKFMTQVINAIKILAKLDISIKRLPQDGRFSARSNLGYIKETRVSTYPTIHGEKLVLRLLNTDSELKSIDTLGIPSTSKKLILKAIKQPQGLILVTGPTGSGKSATLYSLLQLLNTQACNVTTIEDPIEINIDGINQSAINTMNGFDFSDALRALLRQDPDVIMIGEIRDKETAQMAIRAAQTGHLVLTSLHTNNAIETISRLVNMGITPFQLSQAISLVIAQRLVRRLCELCKSAAVSDNDMISNFKPKGCSYCNNGFKGRTGVFEVIAFNEQSKAILFDNGRLKKHDKNFTHTTLWDAAIDKVTSGLTSLCEIYRVIPHD